MLDKKGLQVQMSDDAESLGVQHAAINLDLAKIMLNKKTSEQNIPFASGRTDYYFDAAAVAALDTQIKAVSDNGSLVNLIVLLYRHDNEPNSAANILAPRPQVRRPRSGSRWLPSPSPFLRHGALVGRGLGGMTNEMPPIRQG